MAKKYQLVGAEKFSNETLSALEDVLNESSHLKNKNTRVEIWYDRKEKKVYTNNKTTLRLYNLMNNKEEN